MSDEFLLSAVDSTESSDDDKCMHCGGRQGLKPISAQLTGVTKFVCSNCLETARNTPERVRERFTQIDERIRISTDIFNAEVISITQVKNAIDIDESIPPEKKSFILAQAIEKRYNYIADLIFEKRMEILELESKQRANQTFYNDFARQLREDERAKIRLKDANYVVKEPTKVLKPKGISVESKKWNIRTVRAAAQKYNIPEQLITITCVQRNVGPEDAVKILKEQGL